MAKETEQSFPDENLLEEVAKDADLKIWNLDSVLGFGNYQHFQVWIIQSLIAIIGALNYYHLVFMVSDPPEWGCVDKEGRVELKDSVEDCTADVTADTVCGDDEIYFNTSHQNFILSLPVQHHWLCDKKKLGPGVLTAFYVGMIVNSLVFGQLCDTWGRKPIFHLTNVTFILCRLISFHITSHYIPFIILTALGTGFFPVGVRAGYTICAEICDERGRKYAFISGWVWWVIGLAVLPFLAKYLGDWYTLGMVTTLINIILLLFFPVLPESPRWQLGQGLFKEAAKTIEKMRKINKDPPIPNLPEVLEKIAKMEKKSADATMPGLLSVIKRKSLIHVSVCMALLWSVNDYFYVAGSMNVENLAGDMFVNFSLLSLTEMPSVFIGQFLIDRFGRRWIHTSCMVISTVPFFINIFLVSNDELGTVVVVLSVFSKIASNVGWFIMWVQCIEVFPTPLRGTGMNVSVMVSTLVTMTGPYVVDLGSQDLRYPFIIFTMFGVLGIVVSSLVPETKGMPLAERLEDIDNMVDNFKFFKWKTWREDSEQRQPT